MSEQPGTVLHTAKLKDLKYILVFIKRLLEVKWNSYKVSCLNTAGHAVP
jgi:hypothetical protein